MKVKEEFFGFSPVMWMGVVEDNNDPLKLGRLRVRIFGWHTQETGGGGAPTAPGGADTTANGGNSHDGPNINDTEYARAYFYNFGIDVNDTTTYPPNQVPRDQRAARGFPVPGGDLAGLLDENGNPVAPPMSQIPELASGKGGGGGGGGGAGGGGGGGSEKVPYDDLPWAQVLQPVTSGPNSGIGGPVTGIQKGTWVMGMFLDGGIGREPMVMGSIPGIPMEYSQGPEKGFYDPDKEYPRKTESWDIEEPDTNRLARNDEDYEHAIIEMKKNRQHTSDTYPNGFSIEEPVLDTWELFRSKYPDNKVLETRSGHVFEIDDSPDFERIHVYHKNGSYIEMGGACGEMNRIDKVVGDQFTMTDGNEYKSVHGDINVIGRHIQQLSQTTVMEGKSITLKSPAVVVAGSLTAGSLSVTTGATCEIVDIRGKVFLVKDGIVTATSDGS